MCGIVGFITTTPNAGHSLRAKFLKQALIIDTLRGADSTGMFFNGKYDEPAGYFKTTDDGYRFVKSQGYGKHMANVDKMRFAIGHNRAATLGSVTALNAHPFSEGPVIGVHNGTLQTTSTLPLTQHELKVDVDSHALIHNLAHVEPDEAAEKVLSQVSGSYALIWQDVRDGSLNVARNDERPLHLAKIGAKGQETIVLASEAGQLRWLNDRLGLEIDKIWELDPYYILKYTQENGLRPRAIKYEQDWTAYSMGYGGSAGRWSGWEYYEDDAPVTVTPVGKPQAATPTPQDNKVMWGGRKREIPTVCMDLLDEAGMMISDRTAFVPLASMPSRNGTSTVSGFLERWNYPALIYGVDQGTADKGLEIDQRWTVRPVTTKVMGEAGLTIICYLVNRFEVFERMSERPTKLTPAASSPSGSADTTDDSTTDAYPVWDGNYVDKQTFLEMTAEGCCSCSARIGLEDADYCEWLDDHHVLCPGCSLDELVHNSLPWE